MNNAEDLWGELPEIPEITPPVEILRQQADRLTEKTRGLLVGEVQAIDQADRKLGFALRIRAPALNNFASLVCVITYPLEMYPLSLNPLSGPSHTCRDEEGYIQKLRETLQSPKVQRLVSSLLAQARGGGRSAESKVAEDQRGQAPRD